MYNGYPTGHHPLNQQYLQNQAHLQPPVRLLHVNTNVTAVVGGTARLPCRVKDLGEYTVSNVIQVDSIKYTSSTFIFNLAVDSEPSYRNNRCIVRQFLRITVYCQQ